jgi:hypothetical protein
MLSTKNLRLRSPSRKLTARFIRLLIVEEPVGSQAYRLTLPQDLLVHLVFYTSLLRPYYHRSGELEILLGPIELDDGDELANRYEVEALIGKRKKN